MDKSQQRSLLLACLLLWLPVLAIAADTAQFESEVVVTDQSPALRSTALRTALGAVLVRVTGQPGVTATGPARAMLANPEALVQQYRYFTESGQDPPLLKLWVRFDGDAIRDQLQQQGVAYWGGERPDTLIWLAVEDRDTRYVESADDRSDVRRELDAAARARNMPLLFPLMDLEDQTLVHFTDLWNGNFDPVNTASRRYNPPAILIGRIQHLASGVWAARWQLTIGGKTRSWSDSHPQLAALAQQGVNDVANTQTALLDAGGTAAAAGAAVVYVSGVTSLADYARASNYLATLSTVRDLQVDEVTPSRVQFRLRLNGNLQDLTRTVAVGSVLEPTGDGIDGSYRLRQ
jgi:uncharacterized protein